VGVVGFAMFLAFYGGALVEALVDWKARKAPFSQKLNHSNHSAVSTSSKPGFRSFEVLGASSF
jgi:hypothetical protein